MEILEFIENFKCDLGQFTKKESGIVQQLFENGFCYYFAKILKDAFPGGELCIPWPIGHFPEKSTVHDLCPKCYEKFLNWLDED